LSQCRAPLSPNQKCERFLKQSVQCLLHRPPDHPVQVILDPLIVDRDEIAHRTRCILGHGGSPLVGLVAFSHHQMSQIRGRQPYPIVRKILYVISELENAA
jgi:hypothetical protein